ncbi:hypothetical protein S7711_11372 [Stachybotrys chartarum IBT 7711]|uniref:SnoaL-like domain-containing protein n=1 Tax=Stachybotrys chartarum (strain CBS 109288 / IBT 7711) TaxID=1280523 RepID=A0A084B7Q1_STACB|nr:hypothetical protein S7711_11372 [Stachybotrys chartarum IBT 7711]KFA56637.1 hypothetical protein S40293_10468 [Stachybotrys chartarum IBT 40293]KFA81235.1 hypothetical protein S40288_11316 [Stachybotrys chartarum IBT 40288]
MAEYTSTREGFQRAMEASLTGPPEDAVQYAQSTALPTFYHLFNGQKLEWDSYVKVVAEWRCKISEYKPVVHEFLRSGDQLAARMDGIIKVDGVDTYFESFMFAKVDEASGKMEYLIERSVWGPPGQEPEHGAQ